MTAELTFGVVSADLVCRETLAESCVARLHKCADESPKTSTNNTSAGESCWHYIDGLAMAPASPCDERNNNDIHSCKARRDWALRAQEFRVHVRVAGQFTNMMKSPNTYSPSLSSQRRLHCLGFLTRCMTLPNSH